MGYYDTAQICLNGHVITDSYQRYPQFRQAHCQKCGAPTIHQCQHCGTNIKGDYHVEGFIGGSPDLPAPAYCYQCGKPYPWQVAMIVAAKAMADEMTGLDDADKVLLKASIEHIAAETPMTKVAVVRFKKMLPRMGELADGMRKMVVDIASKTAAELLKGGG